MLKRTTLFVLGCQLAFSLVNPLSSTAQTWHFLGHARIDAHDHQKIHVTRRGGLFSSIQLRINGDPIFFDRVIVHFNNGSSLTLPVRDRISAAARNNVVDFDGERRAVESVELWYFNQHWNQSPTVLLYGS